MALYNYYYEMDSSFGCTTIVSRDKNNQIIFGSNLDFDFAKDFSDLAYVAEYYVKGVHIYTAHSVYGLLGFLRGMKPGKFTIALNQKTILDNNLFTRIIQENPTESIFLVRMILEEAQSFEEA